MDRRAFVASGVGGLVGAGSLGAVSPRISSAAQTEVRAAFPRLSNEVFVSAAAGTPLGTFAEEGIRRYLDFQRLGPDDGRGDYVAEMRSNIRARFGELIGARASEIALVHCTKAGEQIVIDALDPGRHGRNIVTDDMHFTGSLHNLVGLQRSGVDVRIVRSHDWDVSLEEMAAAIDDNTALVTVTLLSNVTGRIEPMKEISEIAHAHGALVFADIIQAAGIVPLDMRALGIDFAAANGYKWLYGVHGAGFLYVRDDLQGTRLPDRIFPGHVQYNYGPWSHSPTPNGDPYVYTPTGDASRYEPGHVSYLGYCGVYEGIKFIQRIGVAEALQHSVRLNARLKGQLDADRYQCLTPNDQDTPIITFQASPGLDIETPLRRSNIVVSLIGNGRVRISPAVYNTEEDMDRLGEALNS